MSLVLTCRIFKGPLSFCSNHLAIGKLCNSSAKPSVSRHDSQPDQRNNPPPHVIEDFTRHDVRARGMYQKFFEPSVCARHACIMTLKFKSNGCAAMCLRRDGSV